MAGNAQEVETVGNIRSGCAGFDCEAGVVGSAEQELDQTVISVSLKLLACVDYAGHDPGPA